MSRMEDFKLHNSRGQSVLEARLGSWRDPLDSNSDVFGPVILYSWVVERVVYQLAAAKTPLEAHQTAAKWTAVGVKQDVLTSSGIGLGLAVAGLSYIKALGEFLAHPIHGLNGMRQIVNSPELRERKVQLTRPINAQVGVVGAQGSAAGGGNQLHFVIPPGERPSTFAYVAGSGRPLQ